MKNHWLKKKIDKVTQAQIDRIMRTFNFDKVRNVIRIFNLTMPHSDLESQARKLLERVAGEDDWGAIGVDCGHGLNAMKLPNGDLVLHFSMELWQEQR